MICVTGATNLVQTRDDFISRVHQNRLAFVGKSKDVPADLAALAIDRRLRQKQEKPVPTNCKRSDISIIP
jgi:hypothetical protein